jgi:hypothetical protein
MKRNWQRTKRHPQFPSLSLLAFWPNLIARSNLIQNSKQIEEEKEDKKDAAQRTISRSPVLPIDAVPAPAPTPVEAEDANTIGIFPTLVRHTIPVPVRGLGRAIPIPAVAGVELKFRFTPGPGEPGIPSYDDDEPAATPAASHAEVSDGVRSARRDSMSIEEKGDRGTGTAARSPHDDACRGSCKGLTGVGGTGS